MCPSKLLALFSAFPITMVIAGPDEQQDELISQKTNLATEQPVRSIATLMRNIRRENPCFTTISTLAIAFVMGFLIMRCFIAISSSRKSEGVLVSRRLASGDDNLCSEGRIFFDKAKDTTWRKLLKPAAIFLGAGAIIGAAMSAGITAGIMKEKSQIDDIQQIQQIQQQIQFDLQLQFGLPNDLGLPPASTLPASTLTLLERLTSLLPQQWSATLKDGRRLNFPVANVNNRLANLYLALKSLEKSEKSEKSNEIEVQLNEFAKTLIKEVLRKANVKLGTQLEKLQKEYETKIKMMVENEIKIVDDEAARAYEAARKKLVEGLVDVRSSDLYVETPDFQKNYLIHVMKKKTGTGGEPYKFLTVNLNRPLTGYLLMLRQYPNLDDTDKTAELKLLARSLLRRMIGNGRLKGEVTDLEDLADYPLKIDFYLGQVTAVKAVKLGEKEIGEEIVERLEGEKLEEALEEGRRVLKEAEKQYARRIDTMINNQQKLERRRRALEETKNMDPIILKTVKDIEMGTFTQATGIGG